jgi:hypothetical protein
MVLKPKKEKRSFADRGASFFCGSGFAGFPQHQASITHTVMNYAELHHTIVSKKNPKKVSITSLYPFIIYIVTLTPYP